MEREQKLGDYLKGALAGKLIDSGSRRVEDNDPSLAIDGSRVLQLDVPAKLLVQQQQELCVHVRNFSSRAARGILLLTGEETARGVSYEFDAPFELKDSGDHCCIAFTWRAPAYSTCIHWSASVQFDEQMGFSLSDCSAATLVEDPATQPTIT